MTDQPVTAVTDTVGTEAAGTNEDASTVQPAQPRDAFAAGTNVDASIVQPAQPIAQPYGQALGSPAVAAQFDGKPVGTFAAADAGANAEAARVDAANAAGARLANTNIATTDAMAKNADALAAAESALPGDAKADAAVLAFDPNAKAASGNVVLLGDNRTPQLDFLDAASAVAQAQAIGGAHVEHSGVAFRVVADSGFSADRGAARFDPMTGQPIASTQRFDPMTGQPIANANSFGSNVGDRFGR